MFYIMKKLFSLLFLLPLFAVAQKVITHIVGPKESFTSIGRLYNVNGREIANYNKIDYDKGLSIGQKLKIPVKGDAVVNTPAKEVPVKEIPVKQTPAKEPAPKEVTLAKTPAVSKENIAPIYHTVAKKETLYHISTLYENVTVADIKKWNHLTADGVAEGSKIIVGYGKGNAAPVKETSKVPDTKKDDAETKKTAKKADEDAKKLAAENARKQQEEADRKAAEPVRTVETITPPVSYTKGMDFKGGIFKAVYEAQSNGKSIVSETGTGGVFKSTSGWEDGKYYCLHNNATPGTILKITNNANGKVVYAKVLDLITDIKQNNGLVIRLSNAAADALSVTDNKLDCTINYSK